MPAFSDADCAHMARALKLAARAQYSAHPNPMVGCVIVNNDAVVGEGWHERAGEPHAEINALAAAGGKAKGATAYVTLEPCAHHGKTPALCDGADRCGHRRGGCGNAGSLSGGMRAADSKCSRRPASRPSSA